MKSFKILTNPTQSQNIKASWIKTITGVIFWGFVVPSAILVAVGLFHLITEMIQAPASLETVNEFGNSLGGFVLTFIFIYAIKKMNSEFRVKELQKLNLPSINPEEG